MQEASLSVCKAELLLSFYGSEDFERPCACSPALLDALLQAAGCSGSAV